jgi:hypothetical protein
MIGIREDHLTTAISHFLDKYALGCDRAAMLAHHLPATAADADANREHQAAELGRRIARNNAATAGLMTELADLGDATSPATVAYRQRIRERFNQLYDETAALQAQLDELNAQADTATDADLINQLPHAPGLLADSPDHIREALAAAFDLHCTYRADQRQITIRATITDTTPGIVNALLATPGADDGTPKRSPQTSDHPADAPIVPLAIHDLLKSRSAAPRGRRVLRIRRFLGLCRFSRQAERHWIMKRGSRRARAGPAAKVRLPLAPVSPSRPR